MQIGKTVPGGRIKIRILERHPRGGVCQLRVSGHALRLPFGRHIIQWVEIFYLSRDLAAMATCIEPRDRTDPALPPNE
jgi:hypothetical protein